MSGSNIKIGVGWSLPFPPCPPGLSAALHIGSCSAGSCQRQQRQQQERQETTRSTKAAAAASPPSLLF